MHSVGACAPPLAAASHVRRARRARTRAPRACAVVDTPAETAAARSALLRAVAIAKRDGGPASRSAALSAISALERCVGVASPTASPLLDGRWALLWTCGAAEAALAGGPGSASPLAGDADAFGLREALQAASDAAYKFFYTRLPFIAGAATAGASLGPARSTGTWQTIDRAGRTVANAAQLELLPGARLTVTVGGSAVAATPTRLDVQFLSFDIELGPAPSAGAPAAASPLRLALPLTLLAPRGSVETTYLDNALRIGRGDKGSVFVCARAGAPEAEEA